MKILEVLQFSSSSPFLSYSQAEKALRIDEDVTTSFNEIDEAIEVRTPDLLFFVYFQSLHKEHRLLIINNTASKMMIVYENPNIIQGNRSLHFWLLCLCVPGSDLTFDIDPAIVSLWLEVDRVLLLPHFLSKIYGRLIMLSFEIIWEKSEFLLQILIRIIASISNFSPTWFLPPSSLPIPSLTTRFRRATDKGPAKRKRKMTTRAVTSDLVALARQIQLVAPDKVSPNQLTLFSFVVSHHPQAVPIPGGAIADGVLNLDGLEDDGVADEATKEAVLRYFDDFFLFVYFLTSSQSQHFRQSRWIRNRIESYSPCWTMVLRWWPGPLRSLSSSPSLSVGRLERLPEAKNSSWKRLRRRTLLEWKASWSACCQSHSWHACHEVLVHASLSFFLLTLTLSLFLSFSLFSLLSTISLSPFLSL